jgi:hypothetical protein
VAEKQLAHIVYFTHRENSPARVEELLAACRHYLTGHDGTDYFSVGSLVPDLQREVNQRDFDVALHVIFADRQSHDLYQVSDRHQEFIALNRDNWSQVRVYDSYLD